MRNHGHEVLDISLSAMWYQSVSILETLSIVTEHPPSRKQNVNSLMCMFRLLL